MSSPPRTTSRPLILLLLAGMFGGTALLLFLARGSRDPGHPANEPTALDYQPRQPMDTSGFSPIVHSIEAWPADASLARISKIWHRVGYRQIDLIDRHLAEGKVPEGQYVLTQISKVQFLHFEGQTTRARQVLEQTRAWIEQRPSQAEKWLYSIVYLQGITAIRQGEDENCIHCRGESSCILPISPSAVHTRPEGSRAAIQHFGDYLDRFPDDLEVRWLLNLAHATLGEHPYKVDPKRLLSLDRWRHSEFDIGRFRDIGHLVGVNRFNQAGGAILEDFDNDGLLDLVLSNFDSTQPMTYFRNKGDGTFEDRTDAAGLSDQLGGLNCVQADFDNDGHVDILVLRGAWLLHPVRPSLLKNNGNGTFSDVTSKAGLLHPVNSNAGIWADYDNDGHLDLFLCCEKQANRLYRNRGNGTFEEVAARAGIQDNGRLCKGAAWIDFDDDGYPDLFLNNLNSYAQLYRNNRNGTFTEVSLPMGIDGPKHGFSCWAWDFDNDGWLDLFATSYDYSTADVVRGIIGQPHARHSTRLFRNLQGKGFEDVTRKMGLDMVFATMGSNFADFDNDGYLDLYLGTGAPALGVLVPNRMFRNVAGSRFAEITGTSGTGHLQKGHGVACGDWNRDGNVDLFVETGGAINGDRYHTVLFQNPGQGNNWLRLKLVGKKSNRSAIGARIKVVTSGEKPRTIHRHVTTGSSFGANPLEQVIGLAKASKVAQVEVYWPTSKTTQVFRDLEVNQALEITEFATEVRKLPSKPIPLPKDDGKPPPR